MQSDMNNEEGLTVKKIYQYSHFEWI